MNRPDEPQDFERPRYTVIHHAVLAQLDISASEYLVLDTVYHLAAKNGYCYKSAQAMADGLNMTERGMRKLLTRLEGRGLLSRTAAGLVCGQLWLDVAYVEKLTPEQSSETGTKFRNKVPKPELSSEKTEKSSVGYIRIENNSKNNSIKVDTSLKLELGEFIKMRKAIRKPITDHGLKLVIKKLKSLYPDDVERQRACLNQSIENSWQGVFELKADDPRQASTTSRVREALRRSGQ